MNMVELRFGYDLWELVKEYANYSQPVPSGIGSAEGQKSTQPESLILAQSERWRQA
jgi:hypothetical protein